MTGFWFKCTNARASDLYTNYTPYYYTNLKSSAKNSIGRSIYTMCPLPKIPIINVNLGLGTPRSNIFEGKPLTLHENNGVKICG